MAPDSGLNKYMKETIIKTKMNTTIKIIDNFFSDEILKKITDYFDKIQWNCQCNKDPNVNLYSDSPYWRIELKDEIFFNSELKNIIEKYFNKKLKLNRVYVVGQTYGQDSNFHIDDESPNTFTFCFYINSETHINDDGLFYLRIPNEKYIITVEPIMNRTVIFPSNYRHKGCGLNRFSDYFRICIAWKFVINTNNK
jgi:hypothetical protein